MKEKVERVRIVDIAEELGLSTATVSNVIHGKTKKISDETVKRVQQLLEERKYIPSMAGMLLAQNNSKIVGVLINNHSKYEKRVLQDPFISSAIDYLSEEIEKRGCFMMVKCMGNTEDIIRFASMWNMEGLIMIGFCDQDYEKLRDGMHIPFVVYDGFFNEINRYANISVDNQKGGYLAGRYLIEKGHSSIMYLADNQICMDLERFHGLIKAMQDAGIDTPKEMFHLIPLTEAKRQEYYLEHLADFPHYTAAFAASDVYAIELMNFLQDKGIRVPEDISVIGFDDIPECKIVRPELTTIRQDSRTRAEMAIQMLFDLRDGKEITINQVLSVQLVERASVK